MTTSVPPSPTSAFQYQTFTIPNISPGKYVLTVQCISAPYPEYPGSSFFPTYPANVMADVGNFGTHVGDTQTVNLTIT